MPDLAVRRDEFHLEVVPDIRVDCVCSDGLLSLYSNCLDTLAWIRQYRAGENLAVSMNV